MRNGDGNIPAPQLHRIGHRKMRITVRMGNNPDTQKLLHKILSDKPGSPDAINIDAPSRSGGRNSGSELNGIEPGGGIGQRLLLGMSKLGDDVTDGIVDGNIRGQHGCPPGLLMRREPGESEPKIAVPGIPQYPSGTDDGRLTGPRPLREPGDGERRAPRGVPRDGLGDPLHGPGHGGSERTYLGRERAAENFFHVTGHTLKDIFISVTGSRVRTMKT